jgi:2-oxo-4-hydroxy-4-carboxy-5-ureidoimidazoline decarboxylase
MLVAAMDLDEDNSAKNAVLTRWNGLDAEPAAREVLPCCGSQGWAEALTARRPFASAAELLVESDAVWARLGADDWQEAFDSHPRIGQTHARAATAESLAWSSEEQRAAMTPDETAKLALAEGNRSYEEKFGRIFIVCALGKSSAEILALLNTRMSHDAAAEMLEAAEQQRQITQIRLRRWLGAN